MELRQLRYFVATVEAGTVSGAADPAARDPAGALPPAAPARAGPRRRRCSTAGPAADAEPHRRGAPARGPRRARGGRGPPRGPRPSSPSGGLGGSTIAAPTVTLTDVVVARSSHDGCPTTPSSTCAPADGLDARRRCWRRGRPRDRHPATAARRSPAATSPCCRCGPTYAGDDPWSAAPTCRCAELLEPHRGRGSRHLHRARGAGRGGRAAGGSFTAFVEAANGTIAQALAASGRGVAVVSDDPRYELVPLAINHGNTDIAIQLIATWDTRRVSAPAMAALAGRLADWVAERYDHR